MVAPLIAAGAVSIGSKLLGGLLSGGKKKSSGLSEEALQRLRQIQVPGIAERQFQVEELVRQGQITPEEATAILQEESQFGAISLDPRLRQAQFDALSSLQQVGTEGGLTATSRARLDEVQRAAAGRERAQRGAILQQFAQRGISGSGLELAAQLGAQQAEAGRVSSEGFQTQALAEQRALQALAQAGQLGGQIRGQEFGEQAQTAQAQDIINRFNAAQTQNVQLRNIGAREEAQRLNLAETQRISDANVQLSNAQRVQRAGLAQQKFGDELALAGAFTKPGAFAANLAAQGEASKQKLFGDLLTTGAQSLPTFFGGGGQANIAAQQSQPGIDITGLQQGGLKTPKDTEDFLKGLGL